MAVPDRIAPPPSAGLESRHCAWRVLQAVAAGAYADAALERELARTPLAPLDRGLATELAYGSIRQRALLDAWITAHARVAAERQPPQLRWLLHVGLYQILFSERVPVSAAVSTSVELARRIGLVRLAPVVNAILRAVLRRRQDLPAPREAWDGLILPNDPAAALALCHSLPSWLAADLLTWLPAGQAEAFARATNQPPALDLRINPLRTDIDAQLRGFAAAGVVALPLNDQPQALTLPDRYGDPRALPGFNEGHWCVQDRHAQAVVPLLAPQPGERILDACAAPGGKTTQIAEWLQDRGELWAVDRSEARLRRLQANADRLGHGVIQTLAADATLLAADRPAWIGYFDRILLDAPCSGLGTLARHADARWRVTPATIEELLVLQSRLLEALLPLLAPAGWLVYATCTVEPRENRGRIEALLQSHPGWQLLQEQQWWPGHQSGDGFYAAVLQAPATPAKEGLKAAEGH
jgi:16S rRNA (cytosine967-C5)-methyltransferase